MSHFSRKLAWSFAAALLSAVPLHADDVTADTVVAKVNGAEITIGHMIELRARLPQQYQQLPDDVLFKGILDQMIQQLLLSSSMTEVTKSEKLQMENDERTSKANIMIQEIIDTQVNDDAIKAAYDAKYANAIPAKEYHAAHILVDSEEKAKGLIDQLNSGADFAELAKANSSDTSAASGGDLGWFGLGMMVKPFEDAVVALQPGQVSAPVQTQFGWHVVKLIETRDAAQPTFESEKDALAETLKQEAVQKAIDALTAASDVQREDTSAIDPAILKNTDLIKN
jgi:peptidyl-prolyl cis-trans isomerase C